MRLIAFRIVAARNCRRPKGEIRDLAFLYRSPDDAFLIPVGSEATVIDGHRMQWSLLRLVVSIAMLLSVCSCVGGGTVTAVSIVWDINDGNKSGLCPIVYDKMIVGCPISQAHEVTTKKLYEMRGAPKSDKKSDGFRVITYEQNVAWRGIVIFIVLPIPVLIPHGHNEANFYYKDDHLERVEYVMNGLDAAICGLHSEGPDGFGCIAHWH